MALAAALAGPSPALLAFPAGTGGSRGGGGPALRAGAPRGASSLLSRCGRRGSGPHRSPGASGALLAGAAATAAALLATAAAFAVGAPLAWAAGPQRPGAAGRGAGRCRRATACRATGVFALQAPPAGQPRFIAGAKAEGAAGCKVVHLVRHAEALVNAAGRAFAKDDPRKKLVRLDAQYFDSALSEKGLAQCKEFRAGTLKAKGPPPEVDLVVASPLTRALQTATAIFGCGEEGRPPLVALEALREFCHKDFQPCDSHRSPQELRESFPHVDFEHVPTGPDTLLGPGVVESTDSADSRIRWLLSWLGSRPEKRIACVGHFQILSRVLAQHLVPAGWDESGYQELGNLDIRTVPIVFE